MGIYVDPKPVWHASVELMNDADQERDAVLTMDWEWIPAKIPGFKPVTTVWLDVAGVCDSSKIPSSEVTIPDGAKVFNLTMVPNWTSTLAGEIILMGSHIHDGGVDGLIYKNGHVICRSVAGYGETPQFISPMGDMAGMEDMDMVHISSMTTCEGSLRTEIGDVWSTIASYNLTAHPPMLESATKLAPVMGISLVYIVADTKSTAGG